MIFPRMTGSDIFTLSQSLWGGIKPEMIFGMRDRQYGWGVRDDFTNLGLVTAISSGVAYYQSEGNFYRSYEERSGSTSTQAITIDNTGYTVPSGLPITTPFGGNPPNTNTQNTAITALYSNPAVIPTPGQIKFNPSNNAADRAFLSMGSMTSSTNVAPFFPYLASNQTPSVLAFECRVKLSSINTQLTNLFIGLAASGAAQSTNPIASNTAFSTTPDLLGFGFLSGDTQYQLGLVYNVASGTVQDQAVSANLNLCTMTTQKIAGQYVFSHDGSTLTDAAYVKLGFKVDTTQGSGMFTPYLNGIPFDGKLLPNKAITGFTNAGTPTIGGTGLGVWPANPMTLCAGLFQKDGTTAATMTMDWWACAQTQG